MLFLNILSKLRFIFYVQRKHNKTTCLLNLRKLCTIYKILQNTIHSWHPLLMSATFLLFMTPAVLSFEIYPFSRKCNKIIHGTSNSFALMSIIAGLYIILDCHLNLSESGIFNSIHAVCGYMTFGLLCLVWLVGITLYGFGCCSDELKRAAMPYHKRLGIFTLFCGYATMLLGLSETVKEQQLSLGQLMAGCVFLTMLGVIFTIIRFVNKRDEIHEYVATENDEPDEEDDDDQMVVET